MRKWPALPLLIFAGIFAALSPAAAVPAAVLMRATAIAAIPSAVKDGTAPYSMVPGALGHNAPVRINADLLAYAQFDDYFAGVTIDDWIVDDMTTSNAALYGRPFSTDDIVRGAGFFHVPSSARMWREALADYFREMS